MSEMKRYIDENGFSWDRGEYVYNWDDSEYRREREEEERSSYGYGRGLWNDDEEDEWWAEAFLNLKILCTMKQCDDYTSKNTINVKNNILIVCICMDILIEND